MLIILFGLTGSGKTFIGQTLQHKCNFTFFEGDDVLPVEMAECIRQKQPFTQSMRNQLCVNIIAHVAALKQKDPNGFIVVSQALYKEQNREQIRAVYPDAIFIEVTANLDKIKERIIARNDWVNEDYAQKISLHYEKPRLKHDTIQNNSDGDEAILQQLTAIFTKNSDSPTIKSLELSLLHPVYV